MNPEAAQLVEDSKVVYQGLARLRAGPHQGSCLAADLEALAVELHPDGDGPSIPLPASSRRRAHDIFQQQSIIKDFEGAMHLGRVVGLEPDGIFQHVQYEDGDSEDLEDHEVLEQLATGPYSSLPFTDSTPSERNLHPGDFVTVTFADEGVYPCRIEELWILSPGRVHFAMVREVCCFSESCIHGSSA